MKQGRRLHMKAARIRKGLTQTEVAEKIGRSQIVIAQYERGKTDIPSSIALQLCKLYDISLDELLKKED